MPTLSEFLRAIAFYVLVTSVALMLSARVFLPSTQRLNIMEALAVQVTAFALAVLPILLIGYLIPEHLAIGIALAIVVQLITEKIGIGGVFAAKNARIDAHKAYVLAAPVVATGWALAAATWWVGNNH